MLDTPRARVGAVLGLLAVLFVLAVYAGTLGPAPGQGAYPGPDDYLPAAGEYAGDRVVAAGRVVGTDPVVIEQQYGAGRSTNLTVEGVEIPVSRGDRLRVFGTLTGPRTLRATNAFTVPRSGLRYTYTVSFLAGLWTLWRIRRGWRLDADRLALVPRDRAPPGSDGDGGGGEGGA